MSQRAIKISFRHKSRSRFGACEVYTSLRVPGVRHPRRKHICYVSAGEARLLEDATRKKIQNRAERLFAALGFRQEITIDWENAEEKLRNVKTGCRRVDRDSGKRQILEWMRGNDQPIQEFAHGPSRPSEIGNEFFADVFLRMHSRIVEGLPGADPAEVASWWEDIECPRLVHSFHRFVCNRACKNPKPCFRREDFLRYLGNRTRRFAIADFLRWKGRRNPKSINLE